MEDSKEIIIVSITLIIMLLIGCITCNNYKKRRLAVIEKCIQHNRSITECKELSSI